ncbi:MAG: YhgE/Pip domain-containing protein [Gordonia sp. (in: high G+C Gram-positive bacteria)]|uniref:YhgE/Pip family protein n=1 Tax=Gordonia sp. (in: high G+C Gram-positive bacteria) TaxID=84139 RepID=UPI0039E5F968
MLAAFSPGSDFKRYYRGRMPRLALAVIILMPLMYGALYLWAFWNPFGAVDKIPVAIVNADEGTQVQGKRVDAGRQVLSGLVDSKQLDLHVVSEKEAVDGLARGEYYFTITLPPDFSARIGSPTSGDAKSAQIVFGYNDANNYLATMIGQTAAQRVVNMVGAQVGAQTFDVVFQRVDPMLGKITEAADGSGQLAAGLIQAKDGADRLKDGAVELNDGAVKLNDGAVKLNDGAVKLSAGAGRLNDGVQELATGVMTATDPLVDALKRGRERAPDIAEMNATAERLGRNLVRVERALGTVTELQSRAYRATVDLSRQLKRHPDPSVRQLAPLLDPVKEALEAQGMGPRSNSDLKAAQQDAALFAKQLNDPNSSLRKALTMFASGALVNDLEKMRGAMTQLTDGAGQLADGAEQLAAGTGQLTDGTGRLTDGTGRLTDGTGTLSDGLGQLSTGANRLATGLKQGADALPKWTDQQQKKLAEVLGDPVTLAQENQNPASNFGTGFAPFFFGLAIFVGSMIAWMLFTPLQPRPIAHGLHPFRVVLASYVPTLGVGILQATVLLLVSVFAVGLRPQHPWATFGFMVLMVAMFMAMIQMFTAVLGPSVGRVVTLASLMIMLTSAGGIYPPQTTAKPFQYAHHVDPMTYTVNGLRQLIVGGIDSRLPTAITVVVGLTGVFLALSTWAARRNRQYNMERLYPPVEA